MAKYKAVYKCPLCGEFYSLSNDEAKEVNYNDLPKLLGKFMSQQQFASNPYLDVPPLNIPHKCKDGSAGLASFAGFKKV